MALRLLTDITFEPDPPALILVAAAATPDFLRRLQAFSPALILDCPDDAAVSAVANACASATTDQDHADATNSCDETLLPVQKTSPLASVETHAKAVVAVRLADDQRARDVVELLKAAGFAAELTRTADELYALLNRARIDLLIIEERLPGFLSGLDVVEMLQRDLLKPDVILLSHVPRSLSERIKALLTNRILSPSVSPAAIADSGAALSTVEAMKGMARAVPPASSSERMPARLMPAGTPWRRHSALRRRC